MLILLLLSCSPFKCSIYFLCQILTNSLCRLDFCFQLQLQKTQYLQLGSNRGQYYGGSLPNVNQIGNDGAFKVRS